MVHDLFAECYIGRFMESMVEGNSGGLYGEEIFPNNGTFTADDIVKFIRFQHGDNDYSYEFGRASDRQLQNNVKATARALLDRIDGDWHSQRIKDWVIEVHPDFIENAKASLKKIIGP